MPFPDSPRVIYRKNPLEEVICQLKFPPILKIDAEIPSAFQDVIRGNYPLLQEVPSIAFNLPTEIANMIPGLIGAKSYLFESSDHVWKVTLNREFLALSCAKYERWETFRGRLTTLVEFLERIYQPPFFIRVGLRYRNTIKRSELNFNDAPWSELLQPRILGELSDADVAPSIQQTAREVLLSLNNKTNGKLRLKHGTVLASKGESTYSIDGDFYREERTETGHAIELLNAFNRNAGKLFRWCITDRLHDRLDPQSIEQPV